MFRDIPLKDITIGTHFRHDLGDITSLAQSIANIGLLNPIIVDQDYALIVGRRRLAACESLQRLTIEARVMDLADPLAAEWDENEQRKPYTPSERVAIADAIEEREREKAKERQKEHGNTAPGRKKNTSGNLPEVLEEQPPVRDIVAARVGWSGRTYQKAKAVVEAAREDPELEDLVEKMDRTGNVSYAFSQLPLDMLPKNEAGEPETLTKPHPVKPIAFDKLFQRIDAFMQKQVIPHIEALAMPDREQLTKMFSFYIDYINETEEPANV